MLGMAPVGAADMKGYDTWVAAPRPRGMKDVGSRQSPSIERIAALRPDLIVVPDYRSTKNLAQLKKIAPVLVTHPYPASRQPAERDGHGLPAARRRRSAAQARGETRAAGPLEHARARQDASSRAPAAPARRWRSRPRAARPARPRSACSPRTRGRRRGPPARACVTAGAAPPATASRRSASKALSRVNGWLAFVYPPQFAQQVGGITEDLGVQAPAGREGQARAHARRDHVAVRRPALDDAVRRPPGGGAAERR